VSIDPEVNDFVYYDPTGTTLFDGGFNWHKYELYIGGSYKSMLIANTGQILDIYNCSTTTTTTSTTTIPTYYYGAIICGTATPKKIALQSFEAIPLGAVIKDGSGICSTLTSVISPTTPDAYVSYSYASSFECLSSIPTTTTTLPVLPIVSMNPSGYSSASESCALAYMRIVLYFDGSNPAPVVGDIIYADPHGLNPYSGGFTWHEYGLMGYPSLSALVSDTGEILSIYNCYASTTTSTTTAAPLTSLLLSSNASSAKVCTELNIETFYVNGMIGVPGNSIFVDSLGTTLAPSSWYLQVITNIAYEWDGSDWTGGSISC
jgi:hypothetical protein